MIDLIIKKIIIDLDEDTKEKCISDIEDYFIKDDWCQSAPFYQTYPILFEREDLHWQKMQKEFFNAFLMHSERCPTWMKAWSYVSFVGKPGNTSDRWHDHYKKNADKISAIMYLQYEDEKNGTMFLHDEYIIIPLIRPNTIYIYDSSIMHSPTTWNYKTSKKNRIVLAVDCYF